MNYTSSMQTKTNRRSLPQGWQWVKLGDICQTTSGGTPLRGTARYYGGNIPWVKSGELNDGFIYSTEETITELGLQNSSAKLFPAGTLLIALYGATVGRLGILNMDSATNQAVCAIFTSDVIERDFLFYYLLGQRDELVDASFGGAQPNISQEIIRSTHIPLPPLDEQRRIASLLNEQLAMVESARKAAQEQLQAAGQLPSAYLREVFESEEAKKWDIVQLGPVAEITGGVQKTPDRAPTNFHKPYLTVRNVKQGYIDLSEIERFEVTPAQFERCRLQSGDILIVEGNGSIDQIGRNALFELEGDDWIHQNHIIRVRLPKENFNPKFVSLFLNSHLGRLQMVEKAKTTSGLYTLSSGKVSSLEIPSPTLAIQQDIVRDLDNKLADVNAIQSGLELQLAEINRLPASLLREAFSS